MTEQEVDKIFREQEVIEAALAWWRDNNKPRNAGERVLASFCAKYVEDGYNG